jgi:hypothetical protein
MGAQRRGVRGVAAEEHVGAGPSEKLKRVGYLADPAEPGGVVKGGRLIDRGADRGRARGGFQRQADCCGHVAAGGGDPRSG